MSSPEISVGFPGFPEKDKFKSTETDIVELEKKLEARGVFYQDLPPDMQEEWWKVFEFAEVGADRLGAKEWLDDFVGRIDTHKTSGHA